MAVLGSIGEKIDLLIRQGGTFGPHRVQLFNPPDTAGVKQPIDLTGCQIRGQIRKKASDPVIAASFVVTITDAANGKFEFELAANITAAIAAGASPRDTASLYVWDMELVDSLSRVIPLYYGDVNVMREVTR